MVHSIRGDNPVREHAHRVGGRYGPLLVALIVLYVSAPVLETGFWSGRFILASYYAVIVVGILGSTEDGRLHAVAALLAGGSFLTNWVGEGTETAPLLRLSEVSGILLLTFSTLAVLRNVLRESRVTANTVLGGVCAYFMMSGIWAFSFGLILVADGDALLFPPTEAAVTTSDVLYFSLITQTTLGYGDIAPGSSLVRAMTGVEALLGQIFLVVLVARLVAQQVTGGPSADDQPAARSVAGRLGAADATRRR